MRIIILLLVFFNLGCRISANLHEIDKNKMFRSAQLTGAELKTLIDTEGIRTVINLRGTNPQAPWYQDELAVTQENNVRLIDISMSAKRIPTRENLLKLLEAFETAERPLLIHCQAGADRSGEAAALYQMLYMGKTKREALKMLSIKYLHLSSFMPAKKYFIRDLWQGTEWAQASYDPCTNDYNYFDKSSCNQPDSFMLADENEDLSICEGDLCVHEYALINNSAIGHIVNLDSEKKYVLTLLNSDDADALFSYSRSELSREVSCLNQICAGDDVIYEPQNRHVVIHMLFENNMAYVSENNNPLRSQLINVRDLRLLD